MSRRGEFDEAGASVVRVGCERHQTLGPQFIDDALNVLSSDPQPPSDLGHGLRATRCGAEDLPARLRLTRFASRRFAPPPERPGQLVEIGDDQGDPICFHDTMMS